MEKRQIGKSDLKVTPISLGTWQFNDGKDSGFWEGQPYEVSKAIVDKALECGINFFDTAEADAYPNSHEVCGRIFEGRRRNIIIADKFGYKEGNREFSKRGGTGYSGQDVAESISRSLEKLKTDYIDLYQCHWPNIVGDLNSVLAELKRQQSLGRIRYYGVSNFGPNQMKALLQAGGEPVSNQVCYNLLFRGIEYEVLPQCQQNNISLLAYSPLQQGLLCGKFTSADQVPYGRKRTRHFNNNRTDVSAHGTEGAEKETFQTIARIREVSSELGLTMSTVSLSWLLQQPQVAAAVVGASRPEQVEQNVKISRLSQQALDKLSLSSDELKKIFGSEIDLWASRTS